MGFKEDFLFWHIIKKLTLQHGYSVLTMSEDQNEVWLENNQKNNSSVLRFMRHDFDWANVLKHDLNRTAANGENIRKQLFKRPITVLNTYITQYKPVDEYESYIKNGLKNNKTIINSNIIDSEGLSEGIQKLEEKLGFSLLNVEEIPSNIEENDIKKMKQEVLHSAIQKRQEEQKVFQNGKPWFTKIFLGIQVLIFIIMEIVGSSESTATLVEFGAKYNPLMLEGEWWRFITPMFLHIGFLHLLMNSVALFYLGSEVEKIYGNARFFLIYLFAGFAGVVASFVFSNGTVAAGASGAIFGCFGALLYFGIVNPKLFLRTMGTNIIVLILINLVLGFTISGIDNAGHIGGLIGGFLATAAVGIPKQMKPIYNAMAGVILVVGSFLLLKYGFSMQQSSNQDVPLTVLAQEYIEAGDEDKAKVLLQKAVNHNLISPNANFLLGNMSIDDKQYDKAKDYYKEAIKLNPEFHQAYYNLALMYLQENDVKQAKVNLDKAIKLAPGEATYKKYEEQINDYLKRNE
ncbi:rhomboid family intramembrane serine protease [Bacillus massiliigorillae]|uniref:rhomboid family intramembrane serine protease n=1 Tax=Bacillus massiliigorillae TaxID=1243664 RepID=UPI0005A629E3|nr:rhomboid family intramembrane serine protease [Bacillus massiliigorillae]